MEKEKRIPGIRIVNKAQLAEAFEVTPTSIDAWVRKGCPIVQRGGRGVGWEFDVFAIYKWKHNIQERADVENPEELPPKERLDYFKGCRERDNYRKEAGELIPANEVQDAWSKIVAATKSNMMALPMRLAPMLVAKTDLRETEDIIRDAVIAALGNLADDVVE